MEPQPTEEDKTERMSSNGGVVLVVERDDLLRGLLVRLVGRYGYEPAPAAGWARAVQLCRDRRPEVVGAILGVRGADGVDGPATLAALRDEVPALPALFVYTDPAPYTVAGLLALGRTAVLKKPFTPEQFTEALGQALGAA